MKKTFKLAHYYLELIKYMKDYLKKYKEALGLTVIVLIIIALWISHNNEQRRHWNCLQNIHYDDVYDNDAYVYDTFNEFKTQEEALKFCLLENKYGH